MRRAARRRLLALGVALLALAACGKKGPPVPPEVRLLIEEISIAARESDLVDQTSGVSARVAIAALELLVSNLERRALATGERPVTPRLCDLQMLLPAITGKVEMVYEGESRGPRWSRAS